MSTSKSGWENGVRAVELSENGKLGACSATYVSQASCPRSCPLRGHGCYAEYGHAAIQTLRLNASEERRAERLARAEARAIDQLTGLRPLRLHVVGDCRTARAARVVARASGRYSRRWGSPVWTYTHAWGDVERADWGEVSVLASCDRTSDVRRARRRGYATSLIVREFASDRVHDLADVRVLPCPEQTRGVNCESCRLCMDADRLYRAGLTIGFQAHSQGRRHALAVIGQ